MHCRELHGCGPFEKMPIDVMFFKRTQTYFRRKLVFGCLCFDVVLQSFLSTGQKRDPISDELLYEVLRETGEWWFESSHALT